MPSAAVVVEVVSPDDETYAKFDFYAAHGVEALIVADPHERIVRCFRRDGLRYVEAVNSELLAVAADELTRSIAWPPTR